MSIRMAEEYFTGPTPSPRGLMGSVVLFLTNEPDAAAAAAVSGERVQRVDVEKDVVFVGAYIRISLKKKTSVSLFPISHGLHLMPFTLGSCATNSLPSRTNLKMAKRSTRSEQRTGLCWMPKFWRLLLRFRWLALTYGI